MKRRHAQPKPDGDLENLRRRIDQVDAQIVDLLNQRARCAQEIAGLKRERGLPVLSLGRERLVIEGLHQNNPGPFADQALERVFYEIISACRSLQAPLQVAFLGPELTFSHQAAVARFGSSCSLAPQASIDEVFVAVERGRAHVGLVPVENSSEGAVGQTLDCFLAHDVKVCGEVCAPIRQALMASADSLAGIGTVYSHPQALAQCRLWLQRHLPAAELVACASTAAAAQRAHTEPTAAAIGSRLAAEHYGLTVLYGGIEDSPHNITRFFILGSEECPPGKHDKTSLLFTADHRPGSLHRALGHLAAAGLNLTRIESRPDRQRPWQYVFFIDLEGHAEQPKVARALAALADEVPLLRVLGSYPADKDGDWPGREVDHG